MLSVYHVVGVVIGMLVMVAMGDGSSTQEPGKLKQMSNRYSHRHSSIYLYLLPIAEISDVMYCSFFILRYKQVHILFYVSVCLYICLSIYLIVYLFFLSYCLFICLLLSFCLSICLLVSYCLSVCQNKT